MEADWEEEIGGGAPIVELAWTGFVDLRRRPEASRQLPEAWELPGLAEVLARLNALDSPVWTTKCDVWELEDFDLCELDVADEGVQTGAACYVDLLPQEALNWSAYSNVVDWARTVCERLRTIELRACRVDLVVRASLCAKGREGFAVTSYVSAAGADRARARRRLAEALAAMADTLERLGVSDESAKSYNVESRASSSIG